MNTLLDCLEQCLSTLAWGFYQEKAICYTYGQHPFNTDLKEDLILTDVNFQ